MSASPSVFALESFRHVWRVTLNGLFFGDFRSRIHACEAVAEAIAALEADGGTATFVQPPETPDGSAPRFFHPLSRR